MDEWVRQAEVWVRQAESWIRQQPPEQIYIAAAVVALTILLLIVGTCAAKPRLLLKFPAFLSTEYCAANAHGFLCGPSRHEIGVFSFAAGDCLGWDPCRNILARLNKSARVVTG